MTVNCFVKFQIYFRLTLLYIEISLQQINVKGNLVHNFGNFFLEEVFNDEYFREFRNTCHLIDRVIRDSKI